MVKISFVVSSSFAERYGRAHEFLLPLSDDLHCILETNTLCRWSVCSFASFDRFAIVSLPSHNGFEYPISLLSRPRITNCPGQSSHRPSPATFSRALSEIVGLVAALALVSERPTLLDHILLTKSVNSVGAYLVRICHNGLWTTVVVDDYFPCTAHKHLVFTQAKHRQMYVPLIEKACAKIFGGYANLTAGTLMEGLQLMTGAPCDQIDLQPIGYPLDGGIVWAKLLSACEFK